MSNSDKLTLAGALFGAQNELSELWLLHNVDGGEERQSQIEAVQEKIREAVKVLGGVDYLLEIGA